MDRRASPNIKINTLTLEQRVEVIKEIDRIAANKEKVTQEQLAAKFKVSQSQISRIKKDRQAILDDFYANKRNPESKRKREADASEVDEALFIWFKSMRSRSIPMNGPMLQEKAKAFACELDVKDFVASSGWLSRWKSRHIIKFRRIQGEKLDADIHAAEKWTSDILPELIKSYSPRDVFNADETAVALCQTVRWRSSLKKQPDTKCPKNASRSYLQPIWMDPRSCIHWSSVNMRNHAASRTSRRCLVLIDLTQRRG